jgi:hypothetical protein
MKSFCSSLLRSGPEYFVALILLGLHMVFISWPGRHATFGSSNLMTNLARMDDRENVTADSLVLAGSSMSGKLLGEYFEKFPAVNMGLDGCGSMEAAAALVDAGKFPQTVSLEVNTLRPTYAEVFQQVLQAQSPLRQSLTRWLPFLAAKERPVDVAYDFLRNRKGKEAGGGENITWTDAVQFPVLPATEAAPEAQDKALTEYLKLARNTITTLRQHKVRLVFVMLPGDRNRPAVDRFTPSILIARMLGREFDIPVFDLRNCAGQETLRFTDTVHLAPTSARVISQLIEKEVLPRIK